MNVGRIARISSVFLILMLVIGFSVVATGDELLSPQLALSATIGAASFDSGIPGVESQAWRLWVKQLNLDREAKGDNIILVTDDYQTGGTDLLDTSALDLGDRNGNEIGTAFKDSEREYELRFFSLPEWYVSPTMPYSEDGHVVWFEDPYGDTEADFDFSADLRSKMKGAELNARWPTKGGTWRFLAGVGKLSLEEDLAIWGEMSGEGDYYADYNIGAKNSLWGGQVGIEAPIVKSKRLSLNCWAKYGFYRNKISTYASIWTGDEEDTFDEYRVESNGHKFCSLREIGVEARYSWSPTQVVSIGSQVMLLDGLATAPAQVPVSDPVGGTASIATGQVVYKGTYASYTFKW